MVSILISALNPISNPISPSLPTTILLSMPESYDATDCPPNTANVLHHVKNLSSPAGHAHLNSSSNEAKMASLPPALSTSPSAYLATALQNVKQDSKQSACASGGEQGEIPRNISCSSPREDSSRFKLSARQVPSLLGMTSTATRLLANMIHDTHIMYQVGHTTLLLLVLSPMDLLSIFPRLIPLSRTKSSKAQSLLSVM